MDFLKCKCKFGDVVNDGVAVQNVSITLSDRVVQLFEIIAHDGIENQPSFILFVQHST